MSKVWETLDTEIATTPMPELYHDKMVVFFFLLMNVTSTDLCVPYEACKCIREHILSSLANSYCRYSWPLFVSQKECADTSTFYISTT